MITKTNPSGVLYLTDGELVDPSQKWDGAADLLIENGKVAAVAKPGALAAKAKSLKAEKISAKGLKILPGFVDLNCSIYEPGAEYIEGFQTGSTAAAAGGFTTLLVKPVTTPVNDNAFVTDFILRKAKENSLVRIIPMGALTSAREGKKLAEIGSMAEAGARAFGDGLPILDSYLMRKALEYTRTFDVPVFCFPEDKTLTGQGLMNEGINSNRLGLRGIPPAAEEICLARDLILARHTHGRIHIQPVTTRGAVALLRESKANGLAGRLAVTAETHPHYFSLTCDSIASYDAKLKCTPPLREDKDVEALIQGLKDGTVDVISSGHQPQSSSSKDQVFEMASFGMTGLETAFSLTYELVKKKKITLSRLVELLSKRPAEILGVAAEVGSLRVGAWADFSLVKLNEDIVYDSRRVHSAAQNSPFLGYKLSGVVKKTFVNGTLVFSERAYE